MFKGFNTSLEGLWAEGDLPEPETTNDEPITEELPQEGQGEDDVLPEPENAPVDELEDEVPAEVIEEPLPEVQADEEVLNEEGVPSEDAVTADEEPVEPVDVEPEPVPAETVMALTYLSDIRNFGNVVRVAQRTGLTPSLMMTCNGTGYLTRQYDLPATEAVKSSIPARDVKAQLQSMRRDYMVRAKAAKQDAAKSLSRYLGSTQELVERAKLIKARANNVVAHVAGKSLKDSSKSTYAYRKAAMMNVLQAVDEIPTMLQKLAALPYPTSAKELSAWTTKVNQVAAPILNLHGLYITPAGTPVQVKSSKMSKTRGSLESLEYTGTQMASLNGFVSKTPDILSTTDATRRVMRKKLVTAVRSKKNVTPAVAMRVMELVLRTADSTLIDVAAGGAQNLMRDLSKGYR